MQKQLYQIVCWPIFQIKGLRMTIRILIAKTAVAMEEALENPVTCVTSAIAATAIKIQMFNLI